MFGIFRSISEFQDFCISRISRGTRNDVVPNPRWETTVQKVEKV